MYPSSLLFYSNYNRIYSDFFPVVVTFLRQLPFIGTALSLPYVRDVSHSFQNIHCRLIFPLSYTLLCQYARLLTELLVHGRLQYNSFTNDLYHKIDKPFFDENRCHLNKGDKPRESTGLKFKDSKSFLGY